MNLISPASRAGSGLTTKPCGFKLRTALLCGAVICGVSGAVAAHAQTLEEALANAYLTNPGLQAARAELRATDETVNQALSEWRPNVEFSTSAGLDRVETNSEDFGSRGLRKPRSGGIVVKQNL